MHLANVCQNQGALDKPGGFLLIVPVPQGYLLGEVRRGPVQLDRYTVYRGY
jgi:hypothetical protein